jgi:hypothetical protein
LLSGASASADTATAQDTDTSINAAISAGSLASHPSIPTSGPMASTPDASTPSAGLFYTVYSSYVDANANAGDF